MKPKQKSLYAAVMAGTVAAAMGLSSISVLAEGEGGTPPSGGNGGTPPDMPSGGSQGGQPGAGGAGGGANTQTYDYSGTTSGALTADGTAVTADQKSYTSSTADENTTLTKNGGTLTVDGVSLEKSGDDTNGDNCNFYGINSISLTVGSGSTTKIANSTLNATSEGSNAIFATDSGTVYANADTITTSAGNSRGLDATYDGTTVANQLKISTQGDHCASLATDRGGGNISVSNSTLNTAGSGSPLLYSTGDIEVDNVTGTATGSQLAGMEGLNTILIYNSSLTSTNTSKTASDPVADGIIIYQSTSGDAESTTGSAATFQTSNSTLKSSITSGSMFYLTNTSANIVLSDTTLDFDSSNADLLMAEGNDANNWGTAGSNGATVKFTGLGETLKGNIEVDTISSIDAYFLDGTTYTGTISIVTDAVNTKATASPMTVNISKDSSWIVTGDSTVSNLNVESGGKIVDESGKTVSIVANGQTVVKGDSAYTVTVTGTYGTTVTTDSTNALSTDYIDRTGFDSTYGTSTTFAKNTASSTSTAAASSTASAASAASSTAESTASTSSNTIYWLIGGIVVVMLAGTAVVMASKKKK
jgi:hypothetical protein